MVAKVKDILGEGGAIARRLGDAYEFRPEQLEMASAVESAFREGHHLLVEADTGVGKSFAYLLPAIQYAVRTKKRVIISTHTIALQEQLIEKDIPLLRAVCGEEFTAVLVKGRGNYLCKRRLELSRHRQQMLFDNDRQLESLWAIEEWATKTTDGSLADLPALPDPTVWDKVCAEQGNCLGKKCQFYKDCFWQGAKRRMQSGTLLVVNHALFFSDLALRMVGVNYLPKYDAVILDEAHTLEDVAGSHFGLNVSENGLRYQLRMLYDPRRGKGILNAHGSAANDAIRDVVDLHELADEFFEGFVQWQALSGRSNGRIHEPNIVPNTLSPKLRDLSLHLRAMLPKLEHDEEITEITSMADKVSMLSQSIEALVGHGLEDAVYWMDVASKFGQRKVSLHAAPVCIANGLKQHLFDKVSSVVMASATLCTSGSSSGAGRHLSGERGPASRGTGVPPVQAASPNRDLRVRRGAYLPHWERDISVYAINFRLSDALPSQVLEAWRSEREEIVAMARREKRSLTPEEARRLDRLHSERVESFLDRGCGECLLRDSTAASVVAEALRHFDGQRYDLLAWSIMPNHVHVVIQAAPGEELSSILHSWKSHSAHAINKLLNRTGEFWQSEYYDHLVRDEKELQHCTHYAWTNPDAAGLIEWNWREIAEDKITAVANGLSIDRTQHGRDARATKPQLNVAEPGARDPFQYIKSRLGVTDCRTLQLGSPFDYSKQATLYLETELPEPNDALRFMPAACEKILHYLRMTNGGAFVLFTSYKMLIDAANRLKESLDALGLPILVQGQQAPRKVLLERFRSTPNSVLFGTASFWQGIDVRGEALRNVIIVKLPFAVPDDPVIEARLDAIKRSGGNAFMDYSVPEAIIKLKQGFGRLIRSKTDTGIVVILDSRVKSKRYGKLFLEALPECKVGSME